MNPFRLEELADAKVNLQRRHTELLTEFTTEHQLRYYQAHRKYVSARIRNLKRALLITTVNAVTIFFATIALVHNTTPPAAIQWAFYIAAATVTAIAATIAHKVNRIVNTTDAHYVASVNDAEQRHHSRQRNT
jgi:archaellum biogenesis protein FlaJ (TadC family)